MAGVLVGGIVAGAAIAFGIDAAGMADSFGPAGGEFVASYFRDQALMTAVAAGVACFGAWSRLQLSL